MEKKIIIETYVPNKIDLYCPADELIGTLNNDVELLKVRIQIAKQKLEGYYFIWKDKKVIIDKDGFYPYQDGLYNQSYEYTKKLMFIND